MVILRPLLILFQLPQPTSISRIREILMPRTQISLKSAVHTWRIREVPPLRRVEHAVNRRFSGEWRVAFRADRKVKSRVRTGTLRSLD